MKKTNTVLCEFYSDSYAPCMVQMRIVNPRLLARVVSHLKANGGPDEETALLQREESELSGLVHFRKVREVLEGHSVRCRVDRFSALTVYGYDCNAL